MKFVLSESGPDLPVRELAEFSLVEIDRRKELSAPEVVPVKKLTAMISAGEDLHILYRVGCTWEVGARLGLDAKNALVLEQTSRKKKRR